MKSNWTRYNLLKIFHRAKTHAQKTIDRTVVTKLLHQPGPQLQEAKVVIHTYFNRTVVPSRSMKSVPTS